MANYSVPKEEGQARAYGDELRCSPKDSVEIAREIRGSDVRDAKEYLERVMDEEEAVPFKRHDSGAGHRKGSGPAGYPVRAAGEVLKTLENAESNAVDQDLDEENLEIVHIAAHRGRELEGFTSRAFGRASPSNRTTTNLEIVLEEKQ